MKNAEELLAAIGFARSRSDAACWRAVRLDRPVAPARPVEAVAEPSSSRPLVRWREILARGSVASPYRISRADG